jgi:hypothetical protein
LLHGAREVADKGVDALRVVEQGIAKRFGVAATQPSQALAPSADFQEDVIQCCGVRCLRCPLVVARATPPLPLQHRHGSEDSPQGVDQPWPKVARKAVAYLDTPSSLRGNARAAEEENTEECIERVDERE